MKLQKLFDGKMLRHFHLKCFILMCFCNYGKSVPIDYCLQPLDKSDCGLKPTPVFSYYKSGSRCEIEFWRGCPTFNKFPDEYLCMHHCIGKLYERSEDNDITAIDLVDPEIKEEYDECKLPMKEGNCGGPEEYKYTFVDYLCIRVVWRGCQSHNLFDDEASCMRNCSKTDFKPQDKDFEDKLDDLPLKDVEAIKEIVDNVMTDTTKPVPVQLKLILPMKKTSEPEISSENTEAYIQVPTPAVETPAETPTYTEATATAVPTQAPAEPAEVPAAPTDAVTLAGSTDSTPKPEQTTEAPSTDKPFKTTAAHAEKHLQTTPEDSGSVDEVIVT